MGCGSTHYRSYLTFDPELDNNWGVTLISVPIEAYFIKLELLGTSLLAMLCDNITWLCGQNYFFVSTQNDVPIPKY